MHVTEATQAIVGNIQLADTEVTTDDEAALYVKAVVEHYSELILPEYKELLGQTDIYVVRQPLCNAQADFETHSIVIFEGLLQVLTFRMEFSHILASVNRHFDVIAAKAGFTRKEFSSIAYAAQSLSMHFLHHPEPLPDLRQYLDEQTKEGADVALHGGLLFILFHELGHLALRHDATSNKASMAPALACLENINFCKQQEFEADAYAFNCAGSASKNYGHRQCLVRNEPVS